jgi:hypothetical protein
MKRILVGIVLLASFTPSVVLAWDAFPTLPPGANYGSSVEWATQSGINTCLAELSASSKAHYYAAIVSNTSPRDDRSDNDAVPYVDALNGAWAGRLRPDLDILMVLGVDNRAVAIHPGSTWVATGFESAEIKVTIDGSSFKNFARSQDYTGAVCALAKAVENRITTLEGRQAAVLESVRASVDLWRSTAPALARRVRAEVSDPKAQGLALAALQTATENIDAASFAVSQKNVPEVQVKRVIVNHAIQRVETFLSQIKTSKTESEEFKAALAAFDEEVDASFLASPGKTSLKGASSECLRQEPSASDLFNGVLYRDSADTCLKRLKQRFKDDKTQYFYRTRIVPGFVLLGLLLGLLGALMAFFWRRNAAKKMAQVQLDIWSKKLGQAGDRLLDLESRFASYLSQSNERYLGHSAALDVESADAVNLVFLMFDQATSIQKRAQKTFDAAPIYSVKNFERCVRLLTTTPISFELGIPEKELRVFLPLTKSYSGTASSVLNELDLRYEEAAHSLTELQGEVDRAMQWSSTIQDARSALEDAMATRVERVFPVEVYLADLRAIEPELDVFLTDATYDPIAANADAEALLARIRALAKRVETGNHVLTVLIDDITPKAQSLRAKVGVLRDAGWAIREPGFDPDAVLDHGSLVARNIRNMIAKYDDIEAVAAQEELLRQIQVATERVSTTVKARDAVPRRVVVLQSGNRRLEGDILDARAALSRLEADHALSAYRVESDNLDELVVVLQSIGDWISRIESQFTREEYLAATADIETCQAKLDEGDALIRAIHEVENLLIVQRNRAFEWKKYIESTLRDLRLNADKPGVGGARRTRLLELESAAAVVVESMEEALPDWHQIHAATGDLKALVEALDAECSRGRSGAALSVDEIVQVKSEVTTLAQEVQTERRDRPHVERFVKEIESEMAQFTELLKDADAPGELIFDELEGLQELVAQAQEIWASERKVIRDATIELSLADGQYSKVARMNFGYGVSPNLNTASAHLTQAKEAANTLLWETVFEEAQRANREIIRQKKACDRQVEVEKAARRAAAAAAAAEAAARRRRASSSSFGSSSSSSSFGSSFSSSGSSSFGSSSSGGSSFGGSSSGGSSW